MKKIFSTVISMMVFVIVAFISNCVFAYEGGTVSGGEVSKKSYNDYNIILYNIIQESGKVGYRVNIEGPLDSSFYPSKFQVRFRFKENDNAYSPVYNMNQLNEYDEESLNNKFACDRESVVVNNQSTLRLFCALKVFLTKENLMNALVRIDWSEGEKWWSSPELPLAECVLAESLYCTKGAEVCMKNSGDYLLGNLYCNNLESENEEGVTPREVNISSVGAYSVLSKDQDDDAIDDDSDNSDDSETEGSEDATLSREESSRSSSETEGGPSLDEQGLPIGWASQADGAFCTMLSDAPVNFSMYAFLGLGCALAVFRKIRRRK